jgi:hypothetical protein
MPERKRRLTQSLIGRSEAAGAFGRECPHVATTEASESRRRKRRARAAKQGRVTPRASGPTLSFGGTSGPQLKHSVGQARVGDSLDISAHRSVADCRRCDICRKLRISAKTLGTLRAAAMNTWREGPPDILAGRTRLTELMFVMLFGNRAADDVTTPPPHI